MRPVFKLSGVAILSVVLSGLTWALTPLPEELPNDKPVDVADMAFGSKPVGAAINGFRRVHGVGSARVSSKFYFAGDTADVNRFLQQVAQERDYALSVVLSTDPGTANVSDVPFKSAKYVEFNWSMTLAPAMRELPFLIPEPGETDEQLKRRREAIEAEMAKGPNVYVVVTVHCAGPIDPARLELPLAFRATVAGRLDRLARVHGERRADAERERLPLLDQSPTTEALAAESRGSIFGSPPRPEAAPATNAATLPTGVSLKTRP